MVSLGTQPAIERAGLVTPRLPVRAPRIYPDNPHVRICGGLGSATTLVYPTSLYTRVFEEILRGGGVQPVRLPARSPNLDAYAERFVRSIKDECLNRVVPLGEGHLRRLVREYVAHYHRERNHQGRNNRLLERAPPSVRAKAGIRRRERLGGLLNFYYREAA